MIPRKRPAFSWPRVLFILSLLAPFGAVSIVQAQSGPMRVQNHDGLPSPERLVFNRIGSLATPPAPNSVHERAVLSVLNEGTVEFEITALDITGPFEVESPPELPAAVAPGDSLELTIRFLGESGSDGHASRGVHRGQLEVTSNLAGAEAVVELAGYWQSQSESGLEPELDEIIGELFGYGTEIRKSEENLDSKGRIETAGEEILAPYWRVADPAQPVVVEALASFYHCCTTPKTLAWFSSEDPATPTEIFTTRGEDGQSVLPRTVDSDVVPARGEFAAASETEFGFVVNDLSWSDPGLNDTSKDDCSGGPETCGHKVRVWPARDAEGELIPDAYFVVADIGTHYDYNDGVYLVSNVIPIPPQGSVGTEHDGEMPTAFALDNYPNPFNPRTTINFALPNRGEVRLEVFDGLGRAAGVLVDGPMEAGRHAVVFEATDLPSGIYIARMTAGTITKSHVLLLVK